MLSCTSTATSNLICVCLHLLVFIIAFSTHSSLISAARAVQIPTFTHAKPTITWNPRFAVYETKGTSSKDKSKGRFRRDLKKSPSRFNFNPVQSSSSNYAQFASGSQNHEQPEPLYPPDIVEGSSNKMDSVHGMDINQHGDHRIHEEQDAHHTINLNSYQIQNSNYHNVPNQEFESMSQYFEGRIGPGHRMDPVIDPTTERNVTTASGKTVFLPCRIRHLGDRTVSSTTEHFRLLFPILPLDFLHLSVPDNLFPLSSLPISHSLSVSFRSSFSPVSHPFPVSSLHSSTVLGAPRSTRTGSCFFSFPCQTTGTWEWKGESKFVRERESVTISWSWRP